MTPKQIDLSSIPFTEQMFEIINDYRTDNLWEWDTMFKKIGICGKGTIDYWKKTGRISYKMVRRLKKAGISLI